MQQSKNLLIITISSACFGQCFRPSSGALNCVYSLWFNAPAMLPAQHVSGDTFAQSSGALDCVYSLWYNAPAMLPAQHVSGDTFAQSSGALDCVYSLWYNIRLCLLAASPVHYTTSCKHSLALLRMGENVARNMLS